MQPRFLQRRGNPATCFAFARQAARFLAVPTAAALTMAVAYAALPSSPARAASTDTLVYKFAQSSESTVGVGPDGRLAQGSDGNFYGVLINTIPILGEEGRGGSIYKVTPAGAITVLYRFDKSTIPGDIYCPTSVTMGNDGNLYGTTLYGGTTEASDPYQRGYGVVFKLTPSGNFTVLHNFTGTDGYFPYGDMVQGPDNAFYGITLLGGPKFRNKGDGQDTSGTGVLFRVTKTGGYRVVHHFAELNDLSDGSIPRGTPYFAKDGMIYGTTSSGGANNGGTVYKIATDGTGETFLHSFNGSDGDAPYGGVIQAPNGIIYGTTGDGGADDYGTVFAMTTSGAGFLTLHNFLGAQLGDGEYPAGSLALGGDGNLYGVTENGGKADMDNSDGEGTVFAANPVTGVSTVHNFSSSEAYSPTNALIQGHDGNLYGIAAYQGTDDDGGGAVYRINTGLPAASGTLAEFFLNKQTVTGGSENALGIVTLSAPAGPGGVAFGLQSDSPALFTVPQSVIVPEGKTVGLFSVTSELVNSTQIGVLEVDDGSNANLANVNVVPASPIASVTRSQMSVVGGKQNAIISFTLAAPTPEDGEVVAVRTSDNNAAAVPGSLYLPAGVTKYAFTATTHAVSSAATVTITVKAGGVKKSVLLHVTQ